MPSEFRAGLERISLTSQNLGDTLGGEIHVDEAGAGIGDLAIVGDGPSRKRMIATPSNMARLPPASGSSDV
jgi:hypothetical protein